MAPTAAATMYLVPPVGAVCAAALPEPLADPPTLEFTSLLGALTPLLTVAAWADPEAAAAEIRPESVSRRSLLRSARISAADWYRKSRSFSSALLTMSSNFGGKSGFSRNGLTNALFKIASV